ncbi:unnamed protein product [Moneuplotes crassus]|uniref:PDZ domain-containing protein n=1 Tax=Euplotes crassus TaxID=5936 RepID=A0AAD1UMG9_EUPCR|nr:unnamed protein product [Moneuplotes crassus]
MIEGERKTYLQRPEKSYLMKNETKYFQRKYQNNLLRNIPFYHKVEAKCFQREERKFFPSSNRNRSQERDSWKVNINRSSTKRGRSVEPSSNHYTPQPSNPYKTSEGLNRKGTFKKKDTKSYQQEISGLSQSEQDAHYTYDRYLDDHSKFDDDGYNVRKSDVIEENKEDYYDEDEDDYYDEQDRSEIDDYKLSQYYECEPLFFIATVAPDSVADREGILPGDQILVVNGISTDEPNGAQKAAQELRKMLNNTTELVIKRGYLLETKKLFATKNDPSGLGVAGFEQYEKWLKNVSPIAKIKKVSGGSPAEEADLQSGDEIVWCNGLTKTQTSSRGSRGYEGESQAFKDIKTMIVKHANNALLPLYVKRNGHLFHAIVKPRTWDGEGLTGMTIIE